MEPAKESKWIVIFTGAICIATICYVIISLRQLQVMQQTLNDTKASSEESSKQVNRLIDANEKLAKAADQSTKIAQESLNIGQQAKLSVMAYRIISESLRFGVGASIQASTDDRNGKPPVAPAPTGADTRPSNDDSDVVYLLFRNLSVRPTAIIDLDVKGKDVAGKERILSGYRDQIKPPFKIEPWGVEMKKLQIEKGDTVTEISIIDIDQNKFVVYPKNRKWTKATPEK